MTYPGRRIRSGRKSPCAYSHLSDGRHITSDASADVAQHPVRYPPILLDTKQGKVEFRSCRSLAAPRPRF
jgi:hypothetical protein